MLQAVYGVAPIAVPTPRLPANRRPRISHHKHYVTFEQLKCARQKPCGTAGFSASDGGPAATPPELPLLPAPSLLPAAPHASAGPPHLDAAVSFLKEHLPSMFSHGDMTLSRYDPQILFQDPIVRLQGRSAYAANVQLLRALFSIDFVLHQTEQRQPNGIITWWTMTLRPRFILWRPTLTLTGQSLYSVDPASGLITSHMDTWDSLDDNEYFSMEAFGTLLRGFFNARQTPSLEGPKYTVLKASDYQIRRYDPYLVAEIAMPSGSGVTAGDGFNDLAGYIFGGNNRSSKMEMTSPVYTSSPNSSVKMEMTSPVFTTSGHQSEATSKSSSSSGGGSIMSFPMESRFGLDPELLPTPNDLRVTRRLEGERLVAALEFDGWPSDWQVRAAERRLRGALALDGIEASDGYVLARYNDPFTLPQFRRNELLINIKGPFEFCDI